MTRLGLSLAVLMSLIPAIAVHAADTPPAAESGSAPAMASEAAPAASSVTTPDAMQPAAPSEESQPNPDMSSPAPASVSSLPTRGMDMANVEHIYGEPLEKLAPVPSKGTPHHPPITRWVYPSFVVYFEYNHVVHAVMKAHPFQDSGNHHK